MTALIFGDAACADAATLHVLVTGLRSGNGTVDVCVFNTDRGFPDCSINSAILSRRQPAKPGSVQFDFDIDPGSHAVSVLHDENNNGRLDTNFFGFPLEGGGVSNNPPPRRGPPRFADAEFRLPQQGGQIVVKLVYP